MAQENIKVSLKLQKQSKLPEQTWLLWQLEELIYWIKKKHIISKEALNIDGLGKKVVDQFWNLKLIREPSDIFELDYNKIGRLEGWGKVSINNLKRAIRKSQEINLDKLIYSIGIRHIWKENAKILAAFFGSIKEFTKLFDFKKRKQLLQMKIIC